MPLQYEKIRDAMKARGESTKEAKTSAAKIFIARGKGGDRSSRAKELASDRKVGK